MKKENFKIFGIILIYLQVVSCQQVNQNRKTLESYDEIILNNPNAVPAEVDSLIDSIFSNLTSNKNENEGLSTNLKYVSCEESNEMSPWHGGTKESYKTEKKSIVALRAYNQYLKTHYTFSRIEALPSIPAPYCPKEDYIYCDSSYPYRTFNGSCNNLLYPWWGMAETPYKRLLKPDYDDGYNSPRHRSVSGRPLPNPRVLAMKVHTPYVTESEWTTLFLFFGQWVAHDVSSFATSTYPNGKSKNCKCYSRDPDCLTVPIPYDDYINRDQECLSIVRASAASDFFNCRLGPRQQTNLVTHWLDMSTVYGSNQVTANRVRKYENGLLKVSYSKHSRLEQLPLIPETKCPFVPRTQKCFITGETRAEENNFILSLHGLWVREHNRIARILYRLNPKWDDETLFQEARRIVIAEYQHIIYREYLPLYLGEKVSKEFGLLPLINGYLYEYNQKLYPQVSSDFAGAAYRASHSMIPERNGRANKYLQKYEVKNINYYQFANKMSFYAPSEDCLYGMLNGSSYKNTPQVNPYMNHHQFEGVFDKKWNKRSSLPVINIERGREIGLPSYNQYRKKCGLKIAYKFDDLYQEMLPQNIKRLANVYLTPDDIDLWTGIVSEMPLKNAAIGPTGACIVAKQFSDLKYGDRFFYENGEDKNSRFTLSQLNEIRQASLARILCDNTELRYIQKHPLLMSGWTQTVNCNNIPRVDLGPWRDQNY